MLRRIRNCRCYYYYYYYYRPTQNHRPTLPEPSFPRPTLPRPSLLRPSLPASDGDAAEVCVGRSETVVDTWPATVWDQTGCNEIALEVTWRETCRMPRKQSSAVTAAACRSPAVLTGRNTGLARPSVCLSVCPSIVYHALETREEKGAKPKLWPWPWVAVYEVID